MAIIKFSFKNSFRNMRSEQLRKDEWFKWLQNMNCNSKCALNYIFLDFRTRCNS